LSKATAEPSFLLTKPNEETKLAELAAKIAAKEKEWPKIRELARQDFNAWSDAKSPDRSGCIARFEFESLDQRQVANEIDPRKPGKVQENPVLVEGHSGKAALLDGDNGFTYPG
jgi:hypothetical protein